MPYVPTEEEKKMFEVFEGHQPTNVDMTRWPEDKFLALIEFFLLFSSATPENPKGWSVKQAHVDEVWEKYGFSMENIYFREFLVRLKVRKSLQFRSRMDAMRRITGVFFRRNPGYITPQIIQLCQRHAELSEMLETFRTELTKAKTEITIQNEDSGVSGMAMKTPEVLYQGAIHKLLSIFNDLAGSISNYDIKKMKTKEKFDALSKMGFILNVARNNKTKSQVFLNLNVAASERQDLEEKLMEYTAEQERANNG